MRPKIEKYFENKDFHYEIIVTQKPHHGREIAAEIAKKYTPCRIYSIGGDGSLFDIVTAIAGKAHIELGVIPCGAGNDFIKNFGTREDFLDIKRQVLGSSIPIDAINAGDFYSLNQCSCGFDAFVANEQKRFKRLPLVSGAMSYKLALLKAMIKNPKNKFGITIDDEHVFIGTYLFALAANGAHYGGGFHSAPKASVTDGLLDIVLIDHVSRRKIAVIAPKYKKGEHLTIKYCTYKRAKTVKIRPVSGKLLANMDGEVFERDEIEFKIVPKAINFIVPNVKTVKNDEVAKKPAINIKTAPVCMNKS